MLLIGEEDPNIRENFYNVGLAGQNKQEDIDGFLCIVICVEDCCFSRGPHGIPDFSVFLGHLLLSFSFVSWLIKKG